MDQSLLSEISIHALREEGDLNHIFFFPHSFQFLSTPSARRATTSGRVGGRHGLISIHALREEGDQLSERGLYLPEYFYPRPPRGGRLLPLKALRPCGNFYPRPPRGGRREFIGWKEIEEYFYPRPPRGGRPSISRMIRIASLFLSTPSARRATQYALITGVHFRISIHALREEGDVPLKLYIETRM